MYHNHHSLTFHILTSVCVFSIAPKWAWKIPAISYNGYNSWILIVILIWCSKKLEWIGNVLCMQFAILVGSSSISSRFNWPIIKSSLTNIVHGGWSSWGSWERCSLTCGGGSHSRVRSCTNPSPRWGGNECQGHSGMSQSCNTNHCPGESV